MNNEAVALNQQAESKFPPGVFVIFSLLLLAMIGFFVIFSLLVLYCTRRLGMSDDHAYALSAAFNALVFALSVPGGYLGGRYLGYRFAVMISLILSVIGLFIMMIPTVIALYWGLAIFTVANAIVLPCLFVLLGRLYHVKDIRRDTGFTIAYIGLNMGSFIASAFSGFVANNLGYGIAYLFGGISTVICLLLFLVYRKDFKPREKNKQLTKLRPDAIRRHRRAGFLWILLSLPITAILLHFADFCNILLIVLGVLCVFFVLRLAFKESRQYRNKLIVFLVLNIVSVMFWALYTLAPSALTIFIANNVDRHFLGFEIPTATYSALNPFFIITVGPLLGMLWMYLNKHGKRVSTPVKFAMSLFLMGAGYLILVPAISAHDMAGYIAMTWIVLSFFLQSVGELFIGPVGYAMVGELVPPRLEGVMMGVLQLASGVAGSVSGYLAKYTTSPTHAINPLLTNATYGHAFGMFGWVSVGVGGFTVLFAIYLRFFTREKTF